MMSDPRPLSPHLQIYRWQLTSVLSILHRISGVELSAVAIALVPLTLWLVIAVIELSGADRAAVINWLHHPVPAVMMVMLLIATFYHSALGLQVVIEDYVTDEGTRFILLIANKLLSIVLAAL